MAISENSMIELLAGILNDLDGDQFPEEAAKELFERLRGTGFLTPVWVEITDNKSLPDQATSVLGFSPEWIDEDFNPDGIRECHYSGLSVQDAEWVSAKWCDSQDYWDADCDTAPTHWCAIPSKPEFKKSTNQEQV